MREYESLAPHTTFATGGPARYFATATTVDEVKEVVRFAQEHTLPLFVLGGGSNLLVSDEGFPGVVLQPMLTSVTVVDQAVDTVRVRVGAGVELDAFIEETVARGWWGIENLSSIPGTVGATPVQNVGAYGVEMSDVIEAVLAFDRDTNKVVTLTHEECGFAYRDSYFKQHRDRYIILAVVVVLSTVPRPQLHYPDLQALTTTTAPSQQAIRETVQAVRQRKFPDWTKEGTAGSFFTNPIITTAAAAELQARYPALPLFSLVDNQVKVPLGWILDKVLGYKGYRAGKVRCFEGQALVVVADHGATTSDVLTFANQVATAVYDATGITIAPEVTIVGTALSPKTTK